MARKKSAVTYSEYKVGAEKILGLPKVLQVAHQYIGKVLHTGGIAVDATIGNGNDTLFLAERVGRTGRVYGFDIQLEALKQTTKRLTEANQFSQVSLFRFGHQYPWHEVLPQKEKGNIDAIMFNLGYLPHGDPAVITQPETTLLACEQAKDWLSSHGVMTIISYTGHQGGAVEENKLIEWARSLSTREYQVIWQRWINRAHAPSILVVYKN